MPFNAYGGFISVDQAYEEQLARERAAAATRTAANEAAAGGTTTPANVANTRSGANAYNTANTRSDYQAVLATLGGAGGTPSSLIPPGSSAYTGSVPNYSTGTSGTGTVGTGTSGGTFDTSNASSGNLSELAARINAMNIAGQTAANEAAAPGSTKLAGDILANASSYAAGNLPTGALNQIGRQAAELGIGSGGNVDAMALQKYFTELGEGQDKAAQMYATVQGASKTAPIYDPTGMLLTPYQGGQLTADANALAEQRAQNLRQQQLAQQQMAQEREIAQQNYNLQVQQVEEANRRYEQSIATANATARRRNLSGSYSVDPTTGRYMGGDYNLFQNTYS